MDSNFAISLCLLLWIIMATCSTRAAIAPESDWLCSQCSACNRDKCPPSEAYPHMTAFDNSLIAGALQSDFVSLEDRGVYSVQPSNNSYFGWESSSGSASGYHRFRNYMDKCSKVGSFLTVDRQGRVSLGALESLTNITEADWKSIAPPPALNHRQFRFWVSHSCGKCLTVLEGSTAGKHDQQKRTLGVSDCRFNGSNTFQLFAFRFHYHNAFCCCGKHNS